MNKVTFNYETCIMVCTLFSFMRHIRTTFHGLSLKLINAVQARTLSAYLDCRLHVNQLGASLRRRSNFSMKIRLWLSRCKNWEALTLSHGKVVSGHGFSRADRTNHLSLSFRGALALRNLHLVLEIPVRSFAELSRSGQALDSQNDSQASRVLRSE